MSLEGKPRLVVGVKEMQNYKKESLPRMSKNDVPSSFRYHSCAGRKKKYLINSLALSLRCGCLGNLHAQYSFHIGYWALFYICYIASFQLTLYMAEVIYFRNCPSQS